MTLTSLNRLRFATSTVFILQTSQDLEIANIKVERELGEFTRFLINLLINKESLEQIQTHPDIDLILIDINMPEMDGLTLLSKLQSPNHNFRTVVVSAYGDMKNIRQAMNQDTFDYQ